MSASANTPGLVRLQAVEGTVNLRDVGGYRADGGTVQWRTLYRSDGLHRLTDAGLEAFSKLGVSEVLDLRDDMERERAPDRLPAGVRLTPMPIFPSAHDHIARNLDVEQLTEMIYVEHAKALTGAVNHLAAEARSGDGAALVHCTAGKDRTGAVVALTLSAIGVDRDDVLHDYAETEKHLAGPWLDEHLDLVLALGMEVTDAVRGLIGASPLPALDRALKGIEREYGSVRDYLISHGLSEQGIERLHRRLVTRAAAS